MGVEDPVVMEGITAVTERITMAMEDIMVAITMEARTFTSADTLVFLTTIPTAIILTPITIRTQSLIPFIRRRLPSLPCTPNRSHTPIGITAKPHKGIILTSQAVRADGRRWFRLLPHREKRGGSMSWRKGLLVLFAVVLLSGCATMPSGPTVRVMPNPGKPFEVFMADDGVCRRWAQQQIGGTSPSQTANENLATSAAVGTIVGAGLGALIGSVTGQAGAGAAIGAGVGLLGGTSIGANEGAASAYQLQQRYDAAYQQCMYSKGNQVPGVVRQPTRAYTPPPPRPPSQGQMSGGPLSIYPRQGQSQEQQAKDLTECHSWAVGQTGYDPTNSPPDNRPGNQMAQMNVNFQRAISACLDGRGYTLR
jgi:hypothetical protein